MPGAVKPGPDMTVRPVGGTVTVDMFLGEGRLGHEFCLFIAI